MDDPFALIATERRALADLVEGLGPEQLETPSLCGAWTVREVAAHIMVGPTGSMGEFLVAMVKGCFSFDRANQIMVGSHSARPVPELVAAMREHAEDRFTPPTMDWHAPLSDVMIHREDVAVPLGLPSDRPVASWVHVLDFLVSPAARRGFVRSGRPAVRLEASDADWTHGEGPGVRGPAAALALTLSGRPASVDRLTGPGVEPLAAWARG